jgi:hypothetical protein
MDIRRNKHITEEVKKENMIVQRKKEEAVDRELNNCGIKREKH